MKEQINNFESICREMYACKQNTEYSPETWIYSAVKQKINGTDNGFTNTNGIRQRVSQIDHQTIFLSLIDNVIKEYEFALKYAKSEQYMSQEAFTVISLLRTQNGMENLMQNFYGTLNGTCESPEMYESILNGTIRDFASRNASYSLTSLDMDLLGGQSQHIRSIFEKYVKEQEFGSKSY